MTSSSPARLGPPGSARLAALLAPLFLLSGATGLVYEIVWSRMLALVFGTTLPAVTTVLATFMAGLALGSLVFGRVADRSRRLLRLYGLLEIGIGLYALCVPAVFVLLRQRLAEVADSSGGAFDALRFLGCLAVLLPPATLMGGTLPILSDALAQRPERAGRVVALLYALNTGGAVLGTLLAGFVLIRWLGMSNTLRCTAALNILLGLLAMALDRRFQPAGLRPEGPAPAPASTGWRTRFVLAAYAAAGAAALACEVAFTRVLTLVLGSSVYAFTAMLATFLFGLALGSAAMSRSVDRSRDPWQLWAVQEIAAGFAVLLAIVLAGRLPVLYLDLYPRLAQASFAGTQVLTLLLAGLVMLLPTLLMGAAFPVTTRLVLDDGGQLGRRVGDVYFVNTLGGIAGSVLAGFVLVPRLGTHRTLELAAIVFVGIGAAALLRAGALPLRRRLVQVAAICALAGVLGWQVPPWDRLLITSGVYVYGASMAEGFAGKREFLFFREGRESLVAVTQNNGIRSLRINGKTDGSTGADMTTQVLLAQLPMLAHGAAQEVVVIGLGTGVTAGSALLHPGTRVRVLEIDPAVVEAAAFFADANGGVLKRPELSVVAADARTWLGHSHEQFDVVISEPSNPWIAGVANLFTLEHFEAARQRLRPDGLMCQWVHSYFMSTDTLRLMVRTFLAAFPQATLWEGTRGDFLILAGRDPAAALRVGDALRGRSPGSAVLADLARAGVASLGDLAGRQLLDADELKAFAGTGPLNTDDLPLVEFLSPMSIQQDTHASNMAAIRAAQRRRPPEAVRPDPAG